jgi:hypothetical protein
VFRHFPRAATAILFSGSQKNVRVLTTAIKFPRRRENLYIDLERAQSEV